MGRRQIALEASVNRCLNAYTGNPSMDPSAYCADILKHVCHASFATISVLCRWVVLDGRQSLEIFSVYPPHANSHKMSIVHSPHSVFTAALLEHVDKPFDSTHVDIRLPVGHLVITDWLAVPIIGHSGICGAIVVANRVPKRRAFRARHVKYIERAIPCARYLLQTAFMQESLSVAYKTIREDATHFAAATHDIRSPIHSIICAIDDISDQTPANEIISSIAVIRQAAVVLVDVVNNALDVSRMLGDAHVKVGGPLFEIGPFLCSVVESIEPLLAANEQHVVARYAADVPEYIHADASVLRRLLLNILINCTKYGPRADIITVKITCESIKNAPVLKFKIGDNGVIPTDERALLFQPYYRGPQMSRDVAGSGLGLYVCRRLCEKHGMAIELSARSETEFVITIPRVDQDPLVDLDGMPTRPALPPVASGVEFFTLAADPLPILREHCEIFGIRHREVESQDEAVNGFVISTSSTRHQYTSPAFVRMPNACIGMMSHPLALVKMIMKTSESMHANTSATSLLQDGQTSVRVLVADDNAFNGKMLKKHLAKIGFTSVTLVTDGRKACEAILHAVEAGDIYTIALLDMNMPFVSGIGVVEYIHVTSPNTISVICTADTTSVTRDACFDKDIRILSKPFFLTDLRRVMAYVTREIP